MEDDLRPEIVGELLGLLAHDLRNPLSALHSNTGFLASALENVDDEMREALSDTLVSCDGLAHIIDNMEVLAHALGGRGPLARQRFDIAALLTEIVNRNLALAKSHGVTLVLERDAAALSVLVEAHRDMTGRAIGNLVRNGIQHAAGSSAVRVSARIDGPDCVISIEDEGMHLSEQLREEGFSGRGQLVAKSARGGRYSRGLGLFSARVAAEAAGARVRSASKPPPSNNVFEISIPLAAK